MGGKLDSGRASWLCYAAGRFGRCGRGLDLFTGREVGSYMPGLWAGGGASDIWLLGGMGCTRGVLEVGWFGIWLAVGGEGCGTGRSGLDSSLY